MSKTLKILVADSGLLLLKELTTKLKSLGYSDPIECKDGLEAYDSILKYEPDIAILDIDLPTKSSLEITKQSRIQNLKTRLILITPYQEKTFLDKARNLGVVAFLFRQSTLTEIESCLLKVLNDEAHISPKLQKYLQLSINKQNVADIITPSEKKILLLIAMNHTTPEIADQLYISKKTVEKHRSNISKKLNLSGKTNSLLLWAKENIKIFND